MKHTKTSPQAWLPEPEKPDAKCTIPEIWSRWSTDIAEFRGWEPANDRIAEYTSVLAPISPVLGQFFTPSFVCASVYIDFPPVRPGLQSDKVTITQSAGLTDTQTLVQQDQYTGPTTIFEDVIGNVLHQFTLQVIR